MNKIFLLSFLVLGACASKEDNLDCTIKGDDFVVKCFKLGPEIDCKRVRISHLNEEPKCIRKTND